MWFKNVLKFLTPISPSLRHRSRPCPLASRLCLEPLEERRLFAFVAGANYDLGIGTSVGGPVAADFNGDGRKDLVATGPSGAAVLLGNGDGTFQAARHSQTGGGIGVLRVGDLNNDSRTDLVMRDTTDVRVLLGKGDGDFLPAQTVVLPSQLPPASATIYPESQTPISCSMGDLNDDGSVDLVIAVVAQHSVVIGYIYYPDENGELYALPLLQQHNVGYLNVLLGTGNGAFGPASVMALGERTLVSVNLGDFTSDGRLDMMMSFLDYSNDLSVLPGNGDGSFEAPRTSTVGGSVGDTGQVAGDFDGDGDLDFVVQDWGLGVAGIARGNGDGTFGTRQILFPATGVNTGSDTGFSVASLGTVGDMDADGDLDIVGTFGWVVDDPEGVSYQFDYVAVLLGDGHGSFSHIPLAPGIDLAQYYGSGVLADLDDDGLPDLIRSQSQYYESGGFVSGTIFAALNDGEWTAPPPPKPSFNMSDVTITEGNTGMRTATFTVTLSAASAQTITVDYATGNGMATAGSDYQAVLGTLTIPAGQVTGTITVPVFGDRFAEASETFFVNLTNATNATIADGQGLGTIVDDEPRISISDVSKKEGKRNQTTLYTFTVMLSAAYDQPVTMSYRTVNGTATAGDGDYIAKTGTLNFAPGETTKTITIEVKGDSKKEASETFYLDLFGNSSNSLFTKNRGLGTILNDD